MKDAYFHIAIYPPHRRYLRFVVNHQHYQFTVLPFGLSMAPKVFTKCMASANVLSKNFRNFIKRLTSKSSSDWNSKIVQHPRQSDGHNCGPLILKKAWRTSAYTATLSTVKKKVRIARWSHGLGCCHQRPSEKPATSDLLKSLRDTVNCSVCQDIFKDPVTLDCGHNFCHSCIAQRWEGLKRNFPCPQCRKRFRKGNIRPNPQLEAIAKQVRPNPQQEEIAKQVSAPAVKGSEGEKLCEEHKKPLSCTVSIITNSFVRTVIYPLSTATMTCFP
ncbi:uncharacterized protein LOC123345850 [Mauremys mutica]|uniref:uncharacterized protein LOC123345850 n=1 Tax=Mauremys mutica TaxID=74926 RepID=UPI001D167876|nr:uncharacterized protein LOC123345850 [Mauremys mutica]